MLCFGSLLGCWHCFYASNNVRCWKYHAVVFMHALQLFPYFDSMQCMALYLATSFWGVYHLPHPRFQSPKLFFLSLSLNLSSLSLANFVSESLFDRVETKFCNLLPLMHVCQQLFSRSMFACCYSKIYMCKGIVTSCVKVFMIFIESFCIVLYLFSFSLWLFLDVSIHPENLVLISLDIA